MLTGTVPYTAGLALPALWAVDLTSNNLTGPVPPEFGSAAEVMLGYNRFNGTLGSTFTTSNTLRHLLMPGNQLTGAAPAIVSNATLLEYDLSGNALGGALPSLPASVMRISLDGNPGLSGTLPAQVRRRARGVACCWC